MLSCRLNWNDSSPGLSPQGPFGGVQAGYNFLRDSLVYGIEADFQGAGIGCKFQQPGNVG